MPPADKTRGRKERLDKVLVERGLAPSREKAQALILSGQVVVGDHAAEKAGQLVDESVEVRLKGEPMPWVSRGALKLVGALDAFALDPAGLRVLDVGASTGGFTDVLLQRGAAAVCALDVGHNQIAWKLRSDPRVTVMEGQNARHMDASILPFSPDAAVCDVSFISLELVLPKIVEVAPAARFIVVLVKPQFEVGRADVGKGGVVCDEAKRLEALAKIERLARSLGCEVIGSRESPITGPAGNVEYLLALRPPPLASSLKPSPPVSN